MILIAISLLIAYGLFFFIILLKKRPLDSQNKTQHSVSVIIAFHNEAEHLPALLKSLESQSYPKDNIEYIFIDDRSEDDSSQIIESHDFFKSDRILRIDSLPENKFGKKNALEHGIKVANYEILLFTDADCICDANWIESTVACYSNDVHGVVGQSYLTPNKKNLVGLFQQAETVFNHIIAERSIAYDKPVMSFGRNFSYRRSAFEAIGGFEQVQHSMSGDDDLILAEFQKHKFNVVYNSESNVSSKTVSTWHEFRRQKVRHMSVARFLPAFYQGIAFLFHGTHFALIVAIAFVSSIPQSAALLALKLLIDYVVFKKMNTILKYSQINRVYIVWTLGYWLYIPIITLMSYTRKMKQLNWK